jgi:hypothetical protein
MHPSRLIDIVDQTRSDEETFRRFTYTMLSFYILQIIQGKFFSESKYSLFSSWDALMQAHIARRKWPSPKMSQMWGVGRVLMNSMLTKLYYGGSLHGRLSTKYG